MKKAEYYINIRLGDGVTEYPKVKGYIEEVTDSNGNTLTIGYDKRSECQWIATELNSGLICNVEHCSTKAECSKHVHNIIDTIVSTLNKHKNNADYYNKWIQPFVDFTSEVNGGF